MSDPRPLIEQITHCSEVEAVWQDAASHPCRRIVATQPAKPEEFQVQEPWAGHVSRAPLLFISSNPSISSREPYPVWPESADKRVDFFEERFGPGQAQVKDGVFGPLREQNPDGTWHSKRRTSFWNICKRNAGWLYERDVVPGEDYAMTELVHCKSKGEAGVAQARTRCLDRWLEPVLASSPALVLVLLGDHARHGLGDYLDREFLMWSVEDLDLAGRRRLVLTARHPNFRGKRRWQDHLKDADLRRLREALAPPALGLGHRPPQ